MPAKKSRGLSDETKKWIERIVFAAITAAVGGGTYTVKDKQQDHCEAMMVRLEGVADACRGYEPADASPAYRQGYRAQESWEQYEKEKIGEVP